MASNGPAELWDSLRVEHGIDSGFYGLFDLEDLPRGPVTEVEGICNMLTENSLPCNIENTLLVMQMRKELLLMISNEREISEVLTELSRGKAGLTGEPLYDLVIVLTPLVLFGRGFFAQLGKRFADGLYDYLTKGRGLKSHEAKEISEVLVKLDYDGRKKLLKYRAKGKWKRS